MRRTLGCMVLMSGLAAAASAQVTPAAGFTPPDDTQSIRVGATIFTNYTYQTDPKITDADGNTVHRGAFDLARTYINVTGNISHVLAFRITPDITRETACPAATCTTNGSLVFRVKYGYLQTNLDDWISRGSYARFGIQQTPYIDYMEGIYRYRFQGTVFVERANYQSSADAGASFRYNFPSTYGDVHVGVYNGENYNKPEVNDQKAIRLRASVRPLATGKPVLRGIRAAAYYDRDNFVKDAARRRVFANVTFEHRFINAAFEYLDTHDQTSAKPGTANVHGKGYTIWATPKQSAGSVGWEGLVRYDHVTPNTATTFAPVATAPNATTPLNSQKQNRIIVGVAYWFPHPSGGATTALMVDYDGQRFDNITTAPTKSVAVHALVNF